MKRRRVDDFNSSSEETTDTKNQVDTNLNDQLEPLNSVKKPESFSTNQSGGGFSVEERTKMMLSIAMMGVSDLSLEEQCKTNESTDISGKESPLKVNKVPLLSHAANENKPTVSSLPTCSKTLNKSQFSNPNVLTFRLLDLLRKTKRPTLLDKPDTSKIIIFTKNDYWSACVGCMKGWRTKMEDAHIMLLETPTDPSVSFFGVFDGHGGAHVSKYAARNLYKLIINQECFRSGHIEEAIKSGFMTLDDVFCKNQNIYQCQGSTAVTILIKNNTIYCGNVGDSRAIAVIDGIVTLLSNDHKPENPLEQQRIEEAGSIVVNNRINGNLSMARALGDFKYKNVKRLDPLKQAVIALPEVTKVPLNKEVEFIVIACDGIWEVLSNYEVAKFVKDSIKEGKHLEKICSELMSKCLANDKSSKGCDNMTILIIVFSEELTVLTDIQKNVKNC